MPKKKIFVDTNEDTGHDAASGLDEKRPKRTLPAAIAIANRDDTILVRMGSTFTTPQLLKSDGITYGVYALGTETSQPPTVRLPRVSTARTTGLLIEGSGNHVTGWDVDGADIGIDVASASHDRKTVYAGNQIEDVRVRRYAWAVRVRANKTTVKAVSTFQGRMYRDGDATATGANAFTLWADEGLTLSDVTLENCYSEDAWAYSTGLTKKPDGSVVEGWGNLRNIKVTGITSHNSGTFFEFGGRLRLANGAPANETVQGVVFEKCLVIDPMGRVLYVNDRSGGFPIDFEDVRFVECTFKADDDKASPVFVGRGHGNLSRKLIIERCVIQGAAQIFNAGPETDIASITRRDNLYIRSDGGMGVGLPLVNGDALGDSPFVNAEGLDFRMKPFAKSIVGALSQAFSAGQQQALRRGQSSSRVFASSIIGGHREVDTWQDMVTLDEGVRVAGMTVYVKAHRLTYRLQSNKQDWLKV